MLSFACLCRSVGINFQICRSQEKEWYEREVGISQKTPPSGINRPQSNPFQHSVQQAGEAAALRREQSTAASSVQHLQAMIFIENSGMMARSSNASNNKGTSMPNQSAPDQTFALPGPAQPPPAASYAPIAVALLPRQAQLPLLTAAHNPGPAIPMRALPLYPPPPPPTQQPPQQPQHRPPQSPPLSKR